MFDPRTSTYSEEERRSSAGWKMCRINVHLIKRRVRRGKTCKESWRPSGVRDDEVRNTHPKVPLWSTAPQALIMWEAMPAFLWACTVTVCCVLQRQNALTAHFVKPLLWLTRSLFLRAIFRFTFKSIILSRVLSS